MTETRIEKAEFDYAQRVITGISDVYRSRVIGQKKLEVSLIAAMTAGGHVLLESVPGLAKTTAAKAVAEAVSGRFSRIQCTPDLLPGDILGTQIYVQEEQKFKTVLGPVFANLVLLDEINRSSAKTQSAMLEAMQERQVTIGGVSYPVPDSLFLVIATQNPVEQEGTYPLSEAQTDRFMLKETIDYPTALEELEIMCIDEKQEEKKESDLPLLQVDDVKRLQQIAKKVYVDAAIKRYIADIVVSTRQSIPETVREYVRMGASPRASQAFFALGKAVALMKGRTYVIPEDVKQMAYPVLRHRICLSYAAMADQVTAENVIDEILKTVRTP